MKGCWLRTKSTIPCTQLTLPSPRRSPRKHERMSKVPIPLNDVVSTVKSVPIDVANIPATVTATVISLPLKFTPLPPSSLKSLHFQHSLKIHLLVLMLMQSNSMGENSTTTMMMRITFMIQLLKTKPTTSLFLSIMSHQQSKSHQPRRLRLQKPMTLYPNQKGETIQRKRTSPFVKLSLICLQIRLKG